MYVVYLGENIIHCLLSHNVTAKFYSLIFQVIHSLTVTPSLRRKGIATAMVSDYLSVMKQKNTLDGVMIVSKAHLIKFYTSIGFIASGLSSFVYGKVKNTWNNWKGNMTVNFMFRTLGLTYHWVSTIMVPLISIKWTPFHLKLSKGTRQQ